MTLARKLNATRTNYKNRVFIFRLIFVESINFLDSLKAAYLFFFFFWLLSLLVALLFFGAGESESELPLSEHGLRFLKL